MRMTGALRNRRTVVFVAADLAVFVAATLLAVGIRYGRHIPTAVWEAIPIWLAISLPAKTVSNALARVYRITWEFVADRDRLRIALAGITAGIAWGVVMHAIKGISGRPAPANEVLALDTLLTVLGVDGIRVAWRLYAGLPRGGRPDDVRRVLVVGAGDAGENLLREMRRRSPQGYQPVGIIDDDPRKLGTYLHGVRVLGGRAAIPIVVRARSVDEVIVAIPSAPGQVVREVVDLARRAGASVRIVPGVAAVLEGRITLETVREVKGEDLLPRETVYLDEESVRRYLGGRTVLVTGAAGSIGSELTRQIAALGPRELVLLENDETRLFTLELELLRTAPRVALRPVVGDVRDQDRVERLFRETRPHIVFHAAAYKHVPLMERNPAEAVTTNIVGTKVVAEAASRHGCERFVFISTDKAVNPTSVMGATKRIAEMIVRRMNEVSTTRYSAVRFGNVLGSRGSLIPVLEEQIRRGGPITITDPAMERYFMTATEAVRLILMAGSLGEGGEVFVLDMGEPVRILDLAETLIRLSGLEPDEDIPIQFTGMRPGEKLKEEILLAEEGTLVTRHRQIFIARLGTEPDPEKLERGVASLGEGALSGDAERIRSQLMELVPTYRRGPVVDEEAAGLVPWPEKLESL
jgi:FlaA1/EpsC-like NDP-sugar epimerase